MRPDGAAGYQIRGCGANLLRRFRREMSGEVECAANPGSAFDPDVTAKEMYQAGANGQSKAGTAVLSSS